mmetsp:Transcript_6633/g.10953  ORF Transcript_6633/g.10953 Transcript_6633/m.10953 type:complete len:83 (+) Transcript_6633:1670-1918(+)
MLKAFCSIMGIQQPIKTQEHHMMKRRDFSTTDHRPPTTIRPPPGRATTWFDESSKKATNERVGMCVCVYVQVCMDDKCNGPS